MRRPLAVVAVLGMAVVPTACGGSDKPQTGKKAAGKKPATTATQPKMATQPKTRTTVAGGRGETHCVKAAAPRSKGAQNLPKPTLKLDAKKTYQAVLDTSCGNFTITLDVKHDPQTSASFVYLAKRGFYDNTIFHRIVPGFVIQGGDPLGTGRGGPGYSVVEPPPSGTTYTKGVVAMAKTEIEDPGTSGSQFYVVTGADAQLPADYAVLGRVTAGQDAVDRIAVVPTDATNPDPSRQERPIDPVVLRRVTVTESKAK